MSETTTRLTLGIELGALTESPLWESHKRGKNWCATIERDPAQPGGLGRTFWPKAKGEFFYLVPSPRPQPGQAVEFGADYYSGKGRATRKRRYFAVIQCDEGHLLLEEYPTGAKAIQAAAGYALAGLVQGQASEAQTSWLGYCDQCNGRCRVDWLAQEQDPMPLKFCPYCGSEGLEKE